MQFSRLVVLSALVVSLQSGLAHADADPMALKGLPAPKFQLPTVNAPVDAQGKKLTKWGPERWTGLPQQPDGSTNPAQKKLVLLSFFATYCEPCKKEMPELSRLYDTYSAQGLGVMLVSIDKGDEQRQQIVELAATNNVKFPVLHDRFQVVARRYSAERLPYVLLLDENGVVAQVHTGYTDDMKLTLENEVRAALGLAPLPPTVAADKKAPATKAAKVTGGTKGKS